MLHKFFNRIALAIILLFTVKISSAQFSSQAISGLNNTDYGASYPFACWGDYDNDGDMDLFRFSPGYSPKVSRNDLTAFTTTFTAPTFNTNNQFSGGVWADMDNDGFLDIVFTSYGNSNNPIFKNSGDGINFVEKNVLSMARYGNLDVADIDLDGDLDVVICGATWGANASINGPKIFRNDGNWVFTEVYAGQLVNVYGSAGQGASVRFADFTNDGLVDIVLSGSLTGGLSSGQIKTQVFRNTGSGFTLHYNSPVPLVAARIDVGDYNSDGKIDFAITGGADVSWTATAYLYMNTGSSFSYTSLPGRTDGSIAFADYDNDGDLDLSILGYSGGTPDNQIYSNSGGTFTNTNYFTNPVYYYNNGTAAWADYNKDGRLDIYCTGSTSGNPSASLMKNTGTAPANTAPNAPTALSNSVSGQDVNLTWTAATDGQTPSLGLNYNVMVGTSPGGINIVAPNSDPSNGYRRIPKIGNAWSNTFFKLKNLAPGIYYWKVQTIDGGFMGSTFADGGTFTIQPPPPTVISPVTYCQNDVASPLTGTPMAGGSLLWYSVATGGTTLGAPPTPSTSIVGTTNYWVSQKVNGIEGTRSQISVVINSTPPTPSVVTPVNYCVGQAASPLTATPGGPGTINWYGTLATGGTGSGTAPTPSTATAGTTTYYLTGLLNGCENSPRTKIDVIVNPIPTGPTVVSPVTYCAGAAASPLAATPGTGGTINWYGTLATGGSASGSAPTPSTGTAGTTTYYVTQTLNGCESTPRTPITVTVNPLTNISSQPTALTLCSGQSGTFAVTASGTSISYQWQVSTDGGGTYTNLSNGGVYSNVNNSALNLTAVSPSLNNYTYRCVVSGTCSVVNSNGVTLTVNTPVTINTQPTSATICETWNNTFYVTATGSGITYQWQVSTNSGSTYTNISNGGIYSGATASALSITGAIVTQNNYYYRCAVNGICSVVNSSPAILTVNSFVTISTQPVATTVCAGNTTTFNIGASGTAIAYQWQESTNGGASYSNVVNGGVYSGANSPTLNILGTPLAMSGYYYRCVVSGTCTGPFNSSGVPLTVNSLPAVSTHPVNSTICLGANTTFSVAATGTSISYQWQVSSNGGSSYSNLSNGGIYSGVTTSILSLTAPTTAVNGYYYRCLVNGVCPPAATSNAGILTINTAPSILPQPTATTICSGGSASFNVGATGTGLTYQWQESTNGGASYSNISNGGIYSNATTSTLSLTGATTTANGNYYRCVVSGPCSPAATSNGVMLTVNALNFITSQPTSLTICPNSNATFAVTATGTGLSYQWQVSFDNGVTYPNLSNGSGYSNVTTASMNITNASTSLNGYRYRCVVNGACPSITSTDAILNFDTTPPNITIQPSPVNACTGGNTSFSIAASGTGLSYQWQFSPNGSSYSDVINGGVYSNATTPTLNITGASTGINGYYYRCIVNSSCASATSNAVTLAVVVTPFVTTQPTAQTICAGNNANFTLAATGGGITYQWQVSTDGGSNYSNLNTSANYPNTTSSSLFISGAPGTFNGNFYRCVVSGTCSPAANSNGVKLTVNTLPAIATQPINSTLCAGGNTSFGITAIGSGITYQWQLSSNGGANFSNITNGGIYSNATTATLSITGATSSENNNYYRCQVSGTCTPVATSNAAILSINGTTVINSQPSASVICTGGNASFNVSATGAGLTYQWQESTNGGSTYNNISNGGIYSGATTATLTLSGTSISNDGYFYRCVLNSTCSAPVNSNGVKLSVNPLPSIVTQPSNSSICSGTSTTFTVAATGTGLTYQWQLSLDEGVTYYNITNSGIYSNATTPTLNITGATLSNNDSYYRCVISSGCAGSLNSGNGVLSIIQAPVVTSAPTGNICSGVAQNYNITGSPFNTTFKWSRATVAGISNAAVSNQSGSSIAESLDNTSGSPVNVTYVISSIANGCAGMDFNYVVTVKPNISTPAVKDTNYCQGSTAASLTATAGSGGTLQWYGTNQTGGSGSSTAPVPSTSTIGQTTYYVSQLNNGCESSRSSIKVTVIASPSAPQTVAAPDYCQGATATALSATSPSGTLNWYGTNATGGTASSTATVPSTSTSGNTNYYVSQSVNGCEGPRASIAVKVNPDPAAPGVTSPITYCQNTSAVALKATAVGGATFNWYPSAVGGTASSTAPVPSTTTVGSTNFYVSQTLNGCESSRSQITVTVLSAIAAPAVTSPIHYCQSADASPLNATTSGNGVLNWYGTNATGGTSTSTATIPSTVNPGTFSYYVSQKENGCESSRNVISVIIDPTPAVDAGADKMINEGSSVTLTATGNATSYVWNKGVSDGVAFSPAATESGYYTVTGTLGSCSKMDSLVLIVLRPNIPEIGVFYNNAQQFSNSQIDLGNTTVLKGPYHYTFTVNNQGYADLNISNISVSSTAPFTINNSLTKTVLKRDSSTTFDLVFQPVDTGYVSAKITIINNDQDEGTYDLDVNAYVKRIVPTLTFAPIGDKDYGSDPFVLVATSSNGKPVTYSTTTPTLVSINKDSLTTLNLGDVIVQASIQEDNLYEGASLEQTFKIKLPLFGLLGSDYLAKNIVTAYQIYPGKDQFVYDWSYIGSTVNFVSGTNGKQVELATNTNTRNGTLQCSIYNLKGELLGKVDKQILVNPQTTQALSLSNLRCAPSISGITTSYITEVELGQLKSVSTYNASGVSDYTQSELTTDLYLGETYTGHLTIHNPTDLTAIGVWIDYNNNGEFEQQEFVFSDYSSDSIINLTDIRIPNIESNIGYKRLRIKVRKADPFAYSQSCVEESEDGETEDYLVNLKARLALRATEYVSANNDGKNDCFTIQGINPRSTVRTLTIFDAAGNVVHMDDFYDNGWCGIATVGSESGKMVPKGTYYFIFKTDDNIIKSFFEFTY